VPLLEYKFKGEKTSSLKGSFEVPIKPIKLSWIKGDHQESFTNYFKYNLGFRDVLVRSYNQLQYSFYNKTSAKDVQIGKDNYLYEGGYIRDYMGINFIGETEITARLKKIKTIQEELEQDSITLIMAFAPGKASYFPEYFPARYDTSKKTLSNYLCYSQKCEELKLNYVDFNSFFMEHKTRSNEPIFPKGGIHWGEYGVAIFLDSLSKYVEQKREISLPSFKIDKIVYHDELNESDRDISDAMNLLIEPEYYKMPTPKIKFYHHKKEVKPRLLIIGDSYGYGITNSPIVKEQYSNVEFWYYNKEIKSGKSNHGTKISDIIVKDEIRRFDVVVLLSTETNLYKFDFDFAKSYYEVPENREEKEIQRVITNIKNNTEWYNQIKEQSKEKGNSLDESLRKNAIFVIKNRK